MNQPDPESGDGRISRRKILKSTSGVVPASGLISSGATGVSAEATPRKMEVDNVRRPADHNEVKNVIRSDAFRDFTDRMRIPPVKKASEEVVEVKLNGQKIAQAVEMSTKYGELRAIVEDNSATSIIFQPDDEKVPPGLKKHYSGSLDWEDGQATFITSSGVSEPIIYTRTTTQQETQLVTDVARENGAVGAPSQTLVTTTTRKSKSNNLKLKSDSEAWAIFGDATYRVDLSSRSLLEKERTKNLFGIDESGGVSIQQQRSCSNLAGLCGFELVSSYPTCILAGTGCTLTTVGAGGCILIVLSICAPGAVSSIYSCYQWCEQCASC